MFFNNSGKYIVDSNYFIWKWLFETKNQGFLYIGTKKKGPNRNSARF